MLTKRNGRVFGREKNGADQKYTLPGRKRCGTCDNCHAAAVAGEEEDGDGPHCAVEARVLLAAPRAARNEEASASVWEKLLAGGGSLGQYQIACLSSELVARLALL